MSSWIYTVSRRAGAAAAVTALPRLGSRYTVYKQLARPAHMVYIHTPCASRRSVSGPLPKVSGDPSAALLCPPPSIGGDIFPLGVVFVRLYPVVFPAFLQFALFCQINVCALGYGLRVDEFDRKCMDGFVFPTSCF